MCEFAVGIDEGEQSFAGAADCFQTVAYLFFGYFSSVSSSRVSLREVIGVMVFIISWVSTRVSRIHESISFSSNSLLMSFRARMRRCSLRTVMSLTRTERFTVPRSLPNAT